MGKHIGLVAHDLAPSQAFERLIDCALFDIFDSGVGFLEKGKKPESPNPPFEEVREEFEQVDFLLAGMSSSPELAQIEILAAKTVLEKGIPLGFYADTYNAWNRPWFAEFLRSAALLFVINEEEANKAAVSFSGPKIVVSGNPMWEDFFFPKLSRNEVRQKLSIPEEKFVILSPGIKSPVVNVLLWGSIIEALAEFKAYHLILSPHPGDQTPVSAYEDLVKFSPLPTQIVVKGVLSASETLPGTDMVVESASTIGIEAAHLRKPVIDFFSAVALARLEKMTGSSEWEPCKLGVSKAVCTIPGLRNEVAFLITPTGSAQMRRRQEEVYPSVPEKGSTIKKMAQAILEVLSS